MLRSLEFQSVYLLCHSLIRVAKKQQELLDAVEGKRIFFCPKEEEEYPRVVHAREHYEDEVERYLVRPREHGEYSFRPSLYDRNYKWVKTAEQY